MKGVKQVNLSHFDFPEVTPLIIQASWGEWYHPNIEQIVSNFETCERSGVITGPLVRVYFDNKMYTVVSVDHEHYESMFKCSPDVATKSLNDDACNDIVQVLFSVLLGDEWVVNGEQFASSEFGKQINPNIRVTFFSPDVGIERYDDGWCWCS